MPPGAGSHTGSSCTCSPQAEGDGRQCSGIAPFALPACAPTGAGESSGADAHALSCVSVVPGSRRFRSSVTSTRFTWSASDSRCWLLGAAATTACGGDRSLQPKFRAHVSSVAALTAAAGSMSQDWRANGCAGAGSELTLHACCSAFCCAFASDILQTLIGRITDPTRQPKS